MRPAQLNVYIHYICKLLNIICIKKNFYGWDEKTYWMSIHGQFSAVGGSGMVRENKEFLCCI